MIDDAERRVGVARRVIEEHLELAAETGRSLDPEEVARAVVAELDGTRH